MNTETGAIYVGSAAIAAAEQRGEPIVHVSDQVAKTMRAGQRAAARATAKRKRKQARTDRKRNKRG